MLNRNELAPNPHHVMRILLIKCPSGINTGMHEEELADRDPKLKRCKELKMLPWEALGDLRERPRGLYTVAFEKFSAAVDQVDLS